MTEKQKALLSRIDDEIGIDMLYEVENNKPESIDDFMEKMQERINEIEVIYYSNAMEYLSENDNSLQNSLAIASDLGYEIKDINSELLATLLKQQEASEKVSEYQDEIAELFYNITE